MNDLTTVEKDVIKHLQAQLKSIRVKFYAGEFDVSASERISFNAPALFVSFLGAQLEPSPSGELLAQTKWAGFLVLHQSQKQHKTEKQLLSNVLAILNNSSLGLSALPIRLQSFEQILTRQLEKGNLSAWVIRWQHDLKLLTPVDDSIAPEQVLVSREPNTGQMHIDDYKEL